MKIELEQLEPGFQSIVLKITLETQEDFIRAYGASQTELRDCHLPEGFIKDINAAPSEYAFPSVLNDVLDDFFLTADRYKDSNWYKGGRKPTKSKKG